MEPNHLNSNSWLFLLLTLSDFREMTLDDFISLYLSFFTLKIEIITYFIALWGGLSKLMCIVSRG